MELTQARVRELFDYRDDGRLVFRARRGPRRAGELAGSIHADGYLSVFVDGRSYLVHRLIFLWHHGWLPDQVDHRDLTRDNNRIGNLRPASRSGNGANRSKYANNSTGLKGVCWHRRVGKYQAQIKSNGKVRHLGYFDDPQAAHMAYVEAAKAVHGEFARAS